MGEPDHACACDSLLASHIVLNMYVMKLSILATIIPCRLSQNNTAPAYLGISATCIEGWLASHLKLFAQQSYEGSNMGD